MATFTKFAQEIKKKYPEYVNVDDAKLAKAFIEKFPAYKDQVTFNPTREEKIGEELSKSGLEELPYDTSKVIKYDQQVPFTVTDKGARPQSEVPFVISAKGGAVPVGSPSSFKTYEFMGIDGKKHAFSGTSYQDAYGQAIASGIVAPPSSKARLRMADIINKGSGGYMAQLAPYQTTESLQGKELSPRALAKDVSSAPTRALSTLYDLMTGKDADLGRTSEESAMADKTTESIVTSPMLLPNILAGAATGAATLPVQIGTGALTGVASGMALGDNYGGKDAALDIGLSMIPAIGSAISGLSKTAAKKSIATILRSKGVDASEDVINTIYDNIIKQGKSVGDIATTKAENLVGLFETPTNIFSNTKDKFDIVKNIYDKLAQDVAKGYIDYNTYSALKSRVHSFASDLKDLNKVESKYGMESEAMDNAVKQLLVKYKDVPQIVQEAEFFTNPNALNDLRLAGVKMAMGEDAPTVVRDFATSPLRYSKQLNDIIALEQYGARPSATSGLRLMRPLETGLEAGKQVITSPELIDRVGSGVRTLSTVAPATKEVTKKKLKEMYK